MSSKKSLRIATVIVGYNSLADLPECLESLFGGTLKPTTVYFLDNSNEDGVIKYIKKHHSRVKIVENTENLGFARGNNVLVERALQDGCDAVFFLNPDTVVDKDCLHHLAERFTPTTLVQPLILLHQDGVATNLVNTAGNPLHYLGFSYAGGNNTPATQWTEERSVALASGAAVLVPAELLKKTGGFEESYFMYHEDVELSYRARSMGYNITCTPKAQVWHKYEFSRNSRKFFYAERNRLVFMFSSFNAKTLILTFPMFVATELMMLLFAALNGWFGAKALSTVSALGRIPYILRRRREIATWRTLPDKTLYPFFTARLSFSEVDGAAIRLFNVFSQAYWAVVSRL